MLQENETKTRILQAVAEALSQFAETGDAISHARAIHLDTYDDSTGASPGRIASGEVDAKGRERWWNWRTPDACAQAEWPLKVRLEWGEGEYRVIWVRNQTWRFDKANQPRRRIVQM